MFVFAYFHSRTLFPVDFRQSGSSRRQLHRKQHPAEAEDGCLRLQRNGNDIAKLDLSGCRIVIRRCPVHGWVQSRFLAQLCIPLLHLLPNAPADGCGVNEFACHIAQVLLFGNQTEHADKQHKQKGHDKDGYFQPCFLLVLPAPKFRRTAEAISVFPGFMAAT